MLKARYHPTISIHEHDRVPRRTSHLLQHANPSRYLSEHCTELIVFHGATAVQANRLHFLIDDTDASGKRADEESRFARSLSGGPYARTSLGLYRTSRKGIDHAETLNAIVCTVLELNRRVRLHPFRTWKCLLLLMVLPLSASGLTGDKRADEEAVSCFL